MQILWRAIEFVVFFDLWLLPKASKWLLQRAACSGFIKQEDKKSRQCGKIHCLFQRNSPDINISLSGSERRGIVGRSGCVLPAIRRNYAVLRNLLSHTYINNGVSGSSAPHSGFGAKVCGWDRGAIPDAYRYCRANLSPNAWLRCAAGRGLRGRILP